MFQVIAKHIDRTVRGLQWPIAYGMAALSPLILTALALWLGRSTSYPLYATMFWLGAAGTFALSRSSWISSKILHKAIGYERRFTQAILSFLLLQPTSAILGWVRTRLGIQKPANASQTAKPLPPPPPPPPHHNPPHPTTPPFPPNPPDSLLPPPVAWGPDRPRPCFAQGVAAPGPWRGPASGRPPSLSSPPCSGGGRSHARGSPGAHEWAAALCRRLQFVCPYPSPRFFRRWSYRPSSFVRGFSPRTRGVWYNHRPPPRGRIGSSSFAGNTARSCRHHRFPVISRPGPGPHRCTARLCFPVR